MDAFHPQMSGNGVQVTLIQRQAEKLGVSPDDVARVWVENFSEHFSSLPEWLRIEEIEEELYKVPETQNMYAETISTLIMQ